MSRESSYNTLVKQVELASDHLKKFTDAVVFPDDDEIAANILKRMRRMVALLDVEALRMLAPYDPYAKMCLSEKVGKDPRRTGGGPSLFEGVVIGLAAIPDELNRLRREREKKLRTANARPKSNKLSPEVTK